MTTNTPLREACTEALMSALETHSDIQDARDTAIRRVIMDTDYTLEALQSIMWSIPIYITGYNLPGCLPDTLPTVFDDLDDAAADLADIMERIGDLEDDPTMSDSWYAAAYDVMQAAAQGHVWSRVMPDGYMYWVEEL